MTIIRDGLTVAPGRSISYRQSYTPEIQPADQGPYTGVVKEDRSNNELLWIVDPEKPVIQADTTEGWVYVWYTDIVSVLE